MSTELIKARKKLNHLMSVAKNYRDTKGYRENLGYDSQNKFEAYLEKLDLNSSEISLLLSEFYQECDSI